MIEIKMQMETNFTIDIWMDGNRQQCTIISKVSIAEMI